MWEEFRKQRCPNRAEILQNILTIIKGRVREVSDKKYVQYVINTLSQNHQITTAKIMHNNKYPKLFKTPKAASIVLL